MNGFLIFIALVVFVGSIAFLVISDFKKDKTIIDIKRNTYRASEEEMEIITTKIKQYEQEYKLMKNKVILLPFISIVLIVFASSFKIISTNYTGIKVTFGQVSENVLPAGFNWKIPFIQKIVDVNNKRQDITVAKEKDKIEAESSERVKLYIENVTITYRISEDKSVYIYKNVANYSDGNSLFDSILISSAIKAGAITFNVTDVTNRMKLEPKLKETIQKAVNDKYGENSIIIENIAVGNIDYDAVYSQMIQDRNNAEEIQKKQSIENKTAAEKAENDNKIAKEKQETENQIKIDRATADAEALKIKAEAEKLANEMKTKSLTPEVLMNYWLDKWDGKLPTVMSDDGSLMLDMSKLMETTPAE